MKVVVHPADEGGCGWYRLMFASEVLQSRGHDVTIAYDHTYQCEWQPSVFGDRVVGLAETIDADVVVIQRPLHRNRLEMIQALQAEGIAVVVEVDDDFHSIHPRNPAWASTNPLQDPEHNRDWLKKACAEADLVTVSTPALAARYGAHGRVAVVRNRVPEKYTKIAGGPYTDEHLSRPPGLLVGWSGSIITHPDDLEVTGGQIPEALGDASFYVIGTGMGVGARLGFSEDPAACGWLPIEAYPEGLQLLDVGLVPLVGREFNDAKSALKGLEFASVGVPFIASPAAEYRRLAGEGIGFLADSPAEWKWHVENFLKDPVLREECSIQWREEIARNHTIEGHAHEWWDAWTAAREFATERRAA